MQIKKFYIFYDFTNRNGYPPFKPLIQTQLKRRMEWLVDLHPNRDQNEWVDYFVNILKDDWQSEFEQRFAHWHLLAYLDLDRCYFIWRNFHKFPSYQLNYQELYDITNNSLFQRDKFKKYIDKYDSQNLSGANLKTYILGILKNNIREKLNLKSSWRILCDININNLTKFNHALQKRKEALERYGVKEPSLSQYIFALKYFIPVYKINRISNPNRIEGSRWPEPELSDFEEAARCYNSERFQSHAPLQASIGAEVTPETLKKWINICIKALQYNPKIVEISDNLNNYEQQNNEVNNVWEFLEFEEEPANLLQQTDLILREKIQTIEHKVKEINSKIPQEFRQAIMPLCYPHQLAILNQEKLGNKIGVHQGTVSRYITRYFETPLLEKLKHFSNEKFNIESYLTTFLEKRFTNPKVSNLLDKVLVEAIKKLDNETQKILKFYYSQRMNVADIARIINSKQLNEAQEINLILSQAKNQLRKELLKKLNKWQAEYVKFWLKNYYQDMIQSVLLNSFKELNSIRQEILQMKYCYKMDERKIISLDPTLNPTLIMREAKQQLQRSLLSWIEDNLNISLDTENQQVIEIIETWLSKNLIYIEL